MSTRREFLRRFAAYGAAGAAGALAGPLSSGLAGPLSGLARPALAQTTEPDFWFSQLQEFAPTYFQPGAPRGLQLSFSSDQLDRRTATWLTSDVDTASHVQWGVVGQDAAAEELTVADLSNSQRGSSEKAPFGDGDDSTYLAAKRDVGPDVHHGERHVWVHRATMSNILPGQRIAYRVGDGEAWSDIQLTKGGPLPDEGFTFTHVGDHGLKRASRRTTDALLRRGADWHLMAGDLSYANGDQRLWDLWSEQYQVMGAQIPTMASPGNHEAKDFMGQTYRTRFSYPNHGSSFFSWTYGNVFMVSSPAGAFFGDEEGAMEDIRYELIWLEHTLARAAAMRAAGLIDFIVCTQHFPSYSNHETRGPISADRVVAAEQILQRYQIDLLLVGHNHMYERSHPMAYGMPTSPAGYLNAAASSGLGSHVANPETYSNATGYIQVIAGSGGNGMYDFTETEWLELRVDERSPFQRWAPWSASSARENCFAEYRVEGPEMKVTGFVFDDGFNEGHRNGVYDDEPDYDANDPYFDQTADPIPWDEFTLIRKAYAEEVPTTPRPTVEILRDVPEAHGTLKYNLAEDCTLHDH